MGPDPRCEPGEGTLVGSAGDAASVGEFVAITVAVSWGTGVAVGAGFPGAQLRETTDRARRLRMRRAISCQCRRWSICSLESPDASELASCSEFPLQITRGVVLLTDCDSPSLVPCSSRRESAAQNNQTETASRPPAASQRTTLMCSPLESRPAQPQPSNAAHSFLRMSPG